MGVIWGLVWAAFAAMWVVFLAQILQLRVGSAALYVVSVAAAWPAIPIGRLAARCARRFPLARFTARAAVGAAVLGGVAVPLLLSGGLAGGFFVIAGYVFCGTLSLALAAIGLRLGWPHLRLGIGGVVYIVLGLLLVLPVPPISRHSYNPVGAFFPFWGLGAPAVAIIWGLGRFLRAGCVPDGSR